MKNGDNRSLGIHALFQLRAMLHVQLRHGADASWQAGLRCQRYGTVRAGDLREESIAVPKEYLADHIKG